MKKIIAFWFIVFTVLLSTSCPVTTIAPSSVRELLAFEFASVEEKVVRSGADIDVFVPFGTDAAHLIAVFTSIGDRVLVNGAVQTSGITVNDFLGHAVEYTVIAPDGSEKKYTVTVTVDAEQLYQNLSDWQYLGSDVRNRFDITLPAGRYYHTPVVICIHGGYWVSGSKADFDESYREYFTDKGYACASINYRYANQTTVTYVQIMEDVRRAIEYIASQTDVWKISPDRFALLGFSAGAVNSALYAHRFNDDDLVRAAVCFSGAYDLTDPGLWASAGKGNLLKFTGDEAHMSEASPSMGIRDLPTLVFHGGFDSLILPAHAAAFDAALGVRAARHDYVLLPSAGHGGYFSDPDVLNKIYAWFALYLD
jgi:acetyl esterase/lipase